MVVLKDHEIMDGNAEAEAPKAKDELESKKAQENNEENEESQDFNVTVDKVIQDSGAVPVSIASSSSLNICHVSLTDAGMLLESGDIIQQSLDGETTSIQIEDGCTLIQNYEAVEESDSSDALAKFVNGQAVQLEDGTTAFIHTIPGDGLQPIQLEDGTMAYLSQSDGELFSGEVSTLDIDNLTGAHILTEITDVEVKASEDKDKLSWAVPVQNCPKTLNKAFKCQYEGCNRMFSTYHHLRVHERSHTGDKPYKCSYGCGKAFATGYGLKSHTRTHTGETPYKCPHGVCQKAFKTSGDLQKHVRTHTGERPFKCPYNGCNRAFTTSNIRKVHIRTHTGERPYVCKFEGCGYAFASATNLKNHTRIHTGEKPYVCTVSGCNKRFTEYSSLYKHHVVHTHSKPYACSTCGKMYRQTSTLALHKRQVHGIIDPVPVDSADTVEIKEDKNASGDSNPSVEETTEVEIPSTSANVKQPPSENSTVTSIEILPEENTTQLLQEHSVYAVQVQNGSPLFTGTLQNIVLVTDPQQLAVLQELVNRGQLETVLAVKTDNTSGGPS